MGRGFVQYHLPDSGREEWVLLSAFIDYRLADGTKLSIMQQPAWCPACARFVVAELLQPTTDLEREIGELQPLLRQRQLRPAGRRKRINDMLGELQRRLHWRSARISPPRCLECGSVEITPIPGSGAFAHPQTGERVVSIGSGWADTASWFAEFSPEGEQLRGEKVT